MGNLPFRKTVSKAAFDAAKRTQETEGILGGAVATTGSSEAESWLRILNEIRTYFKENPNAEF